MDAIWIESDASPRRREAWLLAIAFVFLLLTALAALLAPAVREGSWQAFGTAALALVVLPVWATAAVGLHRQLSSRHPDRDPVLLPVGLLLAGWGVLLILRLSPAYGLRQLVWLMIGASLAWVVLRLPADLRWLRRYRYVWLAGGLLLTAMTLLFGTNPSGGEQRLWLGCCGIYLQPSEPLRLLLLAYLASFLADRLSFRWSERKPGLRTALLPLFFVWGASAGIVLVQRDLGTGTLLLGLLAVMLYVATGRWQVLLAGVILAGLGATAGYALFDVVRLRVQAWLDPWADPMGGSYQVIQGLIAYALAHLPAAFSSVSLLLQPVMAAIFAWLLLAEPLSPLQFAGGAVVLAGIYLARRGSR